jgi:hypothetical protein
MQNLRGIFINPLIKSQCAPFSLSFPKARAQCADELAELAISFYQDNRNN